MRMPIALALVAALAAPIAAIAAPAPQVPFETRVLPGSGATLYAMQDARLPRVWYDLYLEAGERFVPAKFAGMTSLAAEVLDRGPSTMSFETYRRDLFRQGVEIDWEASNRFMIAHVKCRPEQLGAIGRLVRATVAQPRLDATTFAQLKDRVINQRTAMNDDMRALTFHYTKQKLWNFHPNARLPEGWAETLANVQRDDLKGFLAQRLGHPGAFVSAVGPLAPAKVASGLGPVLAGWATGIPTRLSAAPAVAPVRRVILIDKPGALDNQVYMLSPFSGALDSREAAAAEVFLAGMGYGLGARLGRTLRVERGLTYHASSGLRRAEWPSWYVYSFGANTKVPQIVSGIFELFDAAKSGLSNQEVTLAKDQLLKAQATEMETPPDQMRAVAAAVAQGLPASYPYMRPGLIKAVTPAEVQAQAKVLGELQTATLVIMGDASQVQKPVTAALPNGTELSVVKLSDLAAEEQGQPIEVRP
jgi:zinc protease